MPTNPIIEDIPEDDTPLDRLREQEKQSDTKPEDSDADENEKPA